MLPGRSGGSPLVVIDNDFVVFGGYIIYQECTDQLETNHVYELSIMTA